VGTAGQIAKNAMKRWVEPLTEGTDIDVDTDAVKSAVALEIKGLVLREVARILKNMPVYQLTGVTGHLISMGVDKISVADQSVTVHFSVLQFTGMVLIYICIGVVLLGLLVAAPWWAGGLIIFTSLFGS
jgi:hypothetical protein